MQTATKGCSAPQEVEVISLYVTTQTRSAYEGIRPLVGVDDWIEAGRPAISSTCYIYGVTDIRATETGENTWHVDATYYSPYPYEESEEILDVPQDKVLVYKVVDGKAVSTLITVADVDDGRTYIVTGGLTVGDEIVAKGAGLVREGMQVK